MYNKKKRTIIVASLLGLVVCLAVGFAAFSTTLKINGSAKVKPDAGNFKVVFANSKSGDTYSYADVEAVTNPEGLETHDGEINNDDVPTFGEMNVTFTEDNQSATYNLLVANIGKYDAYLTDIDFGEKTCTVPDGSDTDETLAAAACEAINIKVIFNNDSNKTYVSSTDIENFVLAKGTDIPVKVVISYPEGAPLPDGDLDVNFGEVALVYHTVDDSSLYPASQGGGEIIDDPDLCFISLTSGQIDYYNSECSKDVVFPDDLSLPVKKVSSFTYSEERCAYYFDSSGISEYMTQEDFCTSVKNSLEGDSPSTSTALMLADVEFEVVDPTETLVTKVGKDAFSYKGLDSITFNDNIESIGENSFLGNKIQNVVLPPNLSELERNAFSRNKINNIVFNSVIERIENGAFSNNELETLSFPDNVKAICIGAFSRNKISSLNLNKVENIYETAFSNNKLTSVDLSSVKEMIYAGAFENNLITSINFGSQIKEIGANAFENNKLQSVTIPDQVTRIWGSAFDGNNITSVTIGSEHSNVASISKNAFGGSVETVDGVTYGPNQISSVRIHLPGSTYISENLGDNVFAWVSGKSNSNIIWND